MLMYLQKEKNKIFLENLIFLLAPSKPLPKSSVGDPKLGSGSGLKLILDSDPDSNLDPNPDSWIRI
jgi:hypothetical protein